MYRHVMLMVDAKSKRKIQKVAAVYKQVVYKQMAVYKQVEQIADAAYGDSGRSAWADGTYSVCSVWGRWYNQLTQCLGR